MADSDEETPESGGAGETQTGEAEQTAGGNGGRAGAGGGDQQNVALDEFGSKAESPLTDDSHEQRTGHDLEPVFDVPVNVQAVLGRSNLEVSQLLKLAPGAVLELDRKVGEAIDIYVNNRLVARGEVVLVEDHLGVTMTEIVKTDRS